MAVAFDAVGPSSSGANGTTSPLTWTHVCGGSATDLLVGATYDLGTDTGQTMSATYNSVSMTSLGVWHTSGATAGFLQVWYLSGPATGSHSVSITFTGSPSGVQGGSISFTGGGGRGAVQSAVGAGVSANPALTFTGSVLGNMVAAFVGGGSPVTQAGSFTQRYNCVPSSGAAGAGFQAGATIASPGGSTTANWTMTADDWAVAAVEIQGPAKAVAPASAQTSRTWQRRWTRTVRPNIPPQVQRIAAAAGVAAVTAAAPQPVFSRYITGLHSTTGTSYFVDQLGAPRLVWGDAVWALMGNAGRWNSGNWQADYDTFCANRKAQGFTVLYGKPIGTAQSGNIDNNGGTFDGLYPFQGGTPSTGVAGANPSTGLTSAFWARIDYFLNSALSNGITVFMNAIGYDSDFSTGPGPLFGKSTTEFQAFGNALGSRYASQPNLVWHLADDYFGESDSLISAFLTGVRAGGDTHLVAIENMPESTCRFTLDSTPANCTWGQGNAQYNFVYSYDQEYYGVEQAYAESSPLTVIQGDGYFYQGGSTYNSTFDRSFRQAAWWSLASAARGKIHGSESIWQYNSTALSVSSTDWFYANNALNIRTVVEGLTNWFMLLPDTSSTLVTGGRGTRAGPFASGGGGGQYEPAFTSSYVAASYTAAGDLALLYLPNHTTITVNDNLLTSGYTSTWVDPITGATSTATPGGSAGARTFNSTAKGNNSQADPDWVLVLQAPNAVNPAAGAAAVSVAANAPTVAVKVGAGVAAVAAAAPGATVAETAAAGAPAVSVVAPAAAVAETITAGVGTVLAADPGATVAEVVTAGVGIVLAADPGATVSTSAGTTANAGAAAVSVIATDSTVAEGAKPAAAAVLAAATQETAAVMVFAGVAAVAVTAPAPSVAEGVTAGVSTVLAAAPAALAAETVFSGVAVIGAADPGATVNTSGSTTAVAGPAAVAAIAMGPAPAIVVKAGVAAVAAVGLAATASFGNTANAGVAAVAAAAQQAAAAVTVKAAAAAAAAAGIDVPPKFTVGTLTATVTPGGTGGVLTASDTRTGGPA